MVFQLQQEPGGEQNHQYPAGLVAVWEKCPCFLGRHMSCCNHHIPIHGAEPICFNRWKRRDAINKDLWNNEIYTTNAI